MIATANRIPSSAAASHPAATFPSLELLEARRARDGLATLLRAEQTAAADFLLALSDFDRHRGWEPLGHASLFAFLTVELHLSRSAAFWRLSAARLLQRFPDVIEPLRDGRLCLSTTAELAKVLTDENLVEVLPRYFRLSAREAAEVTAALLPRDQPQLRTVVTRLEPERRSAVTAAAAPSLAPALASTVAPAPTATRTDGLVLTSEPTLGISGSVQPAEPRSAHPARAASSRDDVEPLTADLRRLHVTVDAQFLEMLDTAREGLSHSIPGASMEQVLKAALELLLEKQARARGLVKRRRAVVATAAPTAPVVPAMTATFVATPGSAQVQAPAPSLDFAAPIHRRAGPRSHVSAAVRRAVWERDGSRCSWPLDGGGVCGSTHRLELDHVVPWARWGGEAVDDLRLVCHAHNTLAARLVFGERCVGRYARRSREQSS
jgi:hypothetical protein